MTENNSLRVRAYPGDGNNLLAFDLDPSDTKNLAGFAIECDPPDGPPYVVANRLSFKTNFTSETIAAQRIWTPSTEAPIQRFSWIDYPKHAEYGAYKYKITAMYYDNPPGGSSSASASVADNPPKLHRGNSASVKVSKNHLPYKGIHLGFTRGYLSSQAYAEKFQNAPFKPAQESIDFDTAPYASQYEWLGGHARRLLFRFLDECVGDPSMSVDVFAYDLDEPDVIRALAKLGPRLRLILDNAPLHIKPGALEPLAQQLLTQTAGASNVKAGHFRRFAHSKVLIQKKNGLPVKVLTGSANFALRSVYVQANNVIVFDDLAVAGVYAQVFQEAFTNMSGFIDSALVEKWLKFPATQDRPAVQVAFSPHRSAGVSLEEVADAIRGAQSSVLFAIMQLTGGGPVMDAIKDLGSRNIMTYGMSQFVPGDLQIFTPGSPHGAVVPFAYLNKLVPEPFVQEWRGGAGQVIHHKFVVVDFNGPNPKLFTGSSNLASGGEEENGDNLIGFTDPALATRYGVEAIRLVDHYSFRAALRKATHVEPLNLQPGEWWRPYFDPTNLKCHTRQVLAPK